MVIASPMPMLTMTAAAANLQRPRPAYGHPAFPQEGDPWWLYFILFLGVAFVASLVVRGLIA